MMIHRKGAKVAKKNVFETHFVDRGNNECKLPHFVDLYYPNDHGGGAHDINPNGPA